MSDSIIVQPIGERLSQSKNLNSTSNEDTRYFLSDCGARNG